jgi:uncharacterized protein YbbK (DUF523 family)
VSGRPRVGISRCLLGDGVRHDGGHKLAPFLIEALAPEVEWVSVCPEVEVGMGVPREPVRLVASVAAADAGHVRIVGVRTGEDWTARMDAWARERLEQLASMNLSGYVWKARSPSCGLTGVPIDSAGSSAAILAVSGRGRFAAALAEVFPDLPMEDEERLRVPGALEAFLNRVRAFHPAPHTAR